MLCGDLDGWDGEGGRREVQEGGGTCIHIADSLHCPAETNTKIVKQLYSNKKIFKGKERKEKSKESLVLRKAEEGRASRRHSTNLTEIKSPILPRHPAPKPSQENKSHTAELESSRL